MRISLKARASVVASLLFLFLLASGPHAHSLGRQSAPEPAISPDRARGIELYQKGDDREATKALQAATKQHPDDLTAWYYLGLTFERQQKTGDARKAYEKAAILGDAQLTARLNGQPSGSSLTSLKGFNVELKQVAESAAKYIQLARPSKVKRYEWSVRADYLQDFAHLSDPNTTDFVFNGRDVTTKVRVLAKPEPEYTEEARGHQVNGTVTLRCVFAADGKVRAIRPTRSLAYGLTLNAVVAAKRISFIPATKDGKPVSMYMQLEYNFNLH